MKEIAKLLAKYYNSCMPFLLDAGNTWCQLCPGYINDHGTNICTYFSLFVHEHYTHKYCESCPAYMFEDKRKPHQKISNPSRNRPYNSITSLQKEYAFVILKHINKILHQKHFRLIAKLE